MSLTTWIQLVLLLICVALGVWCFTLDRAARAMDEKLAPELILLLIIVITIVNAIVFGVRHVRWHA